MPAFRVYLLEYSEGARQIHNVPNKDAAASIPMLTRASRPLIAQAVCDE